MSDDPTRLTDPSSDAPDALRKLLEQARDDKPTAASIERVEGKLVAALGPGALGTGGAAGSAGAAVKVGTALAVAALLGGGALLATREAEAPAPSAQVTAAAPERRAAAHAAPTAPAPEVAQPAAAPSSEPPTSAATSAVNARPSGTASASGTDASAEARLLGQARGALGSDPARALSLTQEHRRRFASGSLAQEREVIAIEALARLGRRGDAEKRAGDFDKKYPDSAHQRRVGAALERK